MVEHLEVINHREAIFFVEDLISNKESLSKSNIKNIHALIFKEIDNANAGKYRRENVVISGAKHIPPKHYEIDHLMQKVMLEYQSKWKLLHPVIIKNEERAKYYDVLDLADTTMNYKPFIELVSKLVIESEKLWLSLLD